ncbi:hypothetical protein [Nocardia brasiliensis]|uniref:hypothetical protein n=1 Tax=Nocardia brasiliensis TaxID=37326 RepID=UPI00245535A5|nr:hypothetical protein [Nocardia brasiliensis]
MQFLKEIGLSGVLASLAAAVVSVVCMFSAAPASAEGGDVKLGVESRLGSTDLVVAGVREGVALCALVRHVEGSVPVDQLDELGFADAVGIQNAVSKIGNGVAADARITSCQVL